MGLCSKSLLNSGMCGSQSFPDAEGLFISGAGIAHKLGLLYRRCNGYKVIALI